MKLFIISLLNISSQNLKCSYRLCGGNMLVTNGIYFNHKKTVKDFLFFQSHMDNFHYSLNEIKFGFLFYFVI